jgi:heat shock protein HtpX
MIFGGYGGRDDRNRGGNIFAMLATIILAPLAAGLIQAAISRQREYSADRGGAELVGSPVGLANALRDIESASKQIPLEANPATAHLFIMNPFSLGGMSRLFASHPPTEDRIRALMSMRNH